MSDSVIYNTPIVNKDYKGKRIDKFLSDCFPDISRSQIQRLIAIGKITCDDDTIGSNSFKVREGDVYTLEVPPAEEAEPMAQEIPLDIIFEDDDIIVVNKSAGMTVHPAPGAPDKTLVNALLFHCKDLSGIGGVKRPGIVHRIDKETSGILVVAKNDLAHQHLCAQFAEHSIERTYYAIVYGVLSPVSGVIDADIGRSPYDRKKMAVVQKGGKHAVTHYKTEEIFAGQASLVKCNLETGRTHQIRVHLSRLGCGLVGDKVYGKPKKIISKYSDSENLSFINNFNRQALHAKTLGFIHPRSGQKMVFSSEFPTDFENLSDCLRKI
ncbi:MAG: RluA family pseudouridine synthase [Alphaproteobacteria bacterium]|nr:RluA family pseudouridine synthase [Alphaproteobacteria bacterium]